jgi:acid phosphatase
MLHRSLPGAAVALVLALALGCSGSGPAAPGSTRASASRPATPSTSSGVDAAATHKLLIIPLENHSRSEALAQMPHLARWAKRYGHATDYHAITHPSLPNYLAIWGGSTFGVSSDCAVGARGCVPTAPSVFGQTRAAGRTVRAYQESMTRPCQTSNAGRYAPRHGPWPYWLGSRERRWCNTYDVPSGTPTRGPLAHDIAAGTLPVTGELTPNTCNDGHDCSLATVDNWLARWVPVLTAGRDYRAGRLTIVITFDEDDYSQQNTVAFVVIDPRLSGRTVTGRFTHYSLTKWLDDNAGVPELRHARTAPNLRAAFGL